jgi:hypothetical protein
MLRGVRTGNLADALGEMDRVLAGCERANLEVFWHDETDETCWRFSEDFLGYVRRATQREK